MPKTCHDTQLIGSHHYKFEPRHKLTEVRKLLGQELIGPREVSDQSRSAISPASSPPPESQFSLGGSPAFCIAHALHPGAQLAVYLSMKDVSSNRLKDRKKEVIRSWLVRCQKEAPSAGNIVPLIIKDSIPIYLTHLSEALAANNKMDFKSIILKEPHA